MKRFIGVLVWAAAALGLAACGEGGVGGLPMADDAEWEGRYRELVAESAVERLNSEACEAFGRLTDGNIKDEFRILPSEGSSFQQVAREFGLEQTPKQFEQSLDIVVEEIRAYCTSPSGPQQALTDRRGAH